MRTVDRNKSDMEYKLLLIFSISLISANITMVSNAIKVDENKQLALYVKKLSAIISGIGVLAMGVVALIIGL